MRQLTPQTASHRAWLWAACLAAALAVPGLTAAAPALALGPATTAATPEAAGRSASSPAAGQAGQRRWRCDAAYLPARSTWPREVLLRWDAQQLREVRIDGQPVHSFQVQGTELATSLDNERIVFDTATLTWQSDFRGLARGQGRCEALP